MPEDHKILQQTEHRLGVRGERRLSDCELRKHHKVTLFPGEREGDYRVVEWWSLAPEPPLD